MTDGKKLIKVQFEMPLAQLTRAVEAFDSGAQRGDLLELDDLMAQVEDSIPNDDAVAADPDHRDSLPE